ncbi:MAG: MBOAT family O-acyltransferase [Beijerinckiaceae bacterium]
MALNSFVFVLIAFIAVLSCRLFATRMIREVIVLLLSLYFLLTYVTQWSQAGVLFGFLTVVYLIGTAKARSSDLWPSFITILIVALFWLGLFLIKDPELLALLNPFNAHPVKIIGVSYIVFRCITFVLEVVPGSALKPLTFLNYMLFFPTLLAGPIERYQRFDETTEQSGTSHIDWYGGINRILNGFIKKFVIADNLMEFGIFSMISSGQDFSLPILWVGALLMLALLYLDFSGYCDIVIGVAALMGFKITENFNSPFAARNLQEFWGRWHISLGSVIQDYVFSPLSKVAIMTVPRNLQMYAIASIYVLAMVLVAMWHGTTMGFLIFGILQGVVLFTIQIRRERARVFAKAQKLKPAVTPPGRVGLWSGRIATYCFVSLTMIWWQASVPDALKTYKKLLGLL